MRKFESRLKKLEEQRPEEPPFPEFDPENPTRSLFEMIEHSHKYPCKVSEWDETEMGCSAESYIEVNMLIDDEK